MERTGTAHSDSVPMSLPGKRNRSPVWAAVLLLGLSGCGGNSVELVSVDGRITLDGQPLDGAVVRFTPVLDTEGGTVRPSSGKTGADGRYSLAFSTTQTGIRPGKYEVRITTYVPPVPDSTPAVPERVPEVYNGATTLTADVTDKKSTFDFELKSDAGRIRQPSHQ